MKAVASICFLLVLHIKDFSTSTSMTSFFVNETFESYVVCSLLEKIAYKQQKYIKVSSKLMRWEKILTQNFVQLKFKVYTYIIL